MISRNLTLTGAICAMLSLPAIAQQMVITQQPSNIPPQINTMPPQAHTIMIDPSQLVSYPEFSRDSHKYYDSVRDTNTAGRFNDVVRFLADQLTQNRDVKNIADSSFAVASIVALDDVSRTNKVGYLIQEHLLHELQVRGYRVIDFKLMNDQLQVTQQGDFVFSRDPKKLKKTLDIANIVSGTYSFQAEGVIINLRSVDTRSGVITSTAQGYIPRGEYEYLMTGKPAVFLNGEYFYRAAPQVRIIDVPVPYEGTHNTINIQ
jgi:TolB-like protein